MAVTKTRNWNVHSIIFQLLTKKFRFRVSDTKVEVFRARERYFMASEQRIWKQMGWNSPFCSIPFLNYPTLPHLCINHYMYVNK